MRYWSWITEEEEWCPEVASKTSKTIKNFSLTDSNPHRSGKKEVTPQSSVVALGPIERVVVNRLRSARLAKLLEF